MKRQMMILFGTAVFALAMQQAFTQVRDFDQLPGFMARYQERETAFSRYRFSTSHAALSNAKTNIWAGQLAAMDASFMGRPNEALHFFPIVSVPPASTPEISHYRTVDARAWIARQASQHDVVMINEAHHVPQTRLLTLSLLKPLHDAGYHYLALETLENTGKDPLPDGYPVESSGGYTREPVMAELVREALRLGYTLVPYEASARDISDIGSREIAQARHLAAFLKAHPGAKLLVHAGYAHIAKTDIVRIAGARTMATELLAISPASVLSVDQTELMPMSQASRASITVQAHLAKAFGVTGPVVFLARQGGAAWSTKPGAYDASVLLPPSPSNVVRPDWLSLDGVRRKVYLGSDPCADNFPCLLQAFVLGEPTNAIPADQFVFALPSEEHTPLFLRDGSYRLRYTTALDQMVLERRIDVPYNTGYIGPTRTP